MAKAILILGIYLSVNNNFREQLISLVPIIFDDNLIVIALIFFVSFTFSIMKNIVVFPARSRLPVKLFFFVLLLDQYQVLVVYLNLLQYVYCIFVFQISITK